MIAVDEVPSHFHGRTQNVSKDVLKPDMFSALAAFLKDNAEGIVAHCDDVVRDSRRQLLATYVDWLLLCGDSLMPERHEEMSWLKSLGRGGFWRPGLGTFGNYAPLYLVQVMLLVFHTRTVNQASSPLAPIMKRFVGT